MGEEFQAGVCGSTWWSSPRGSIGISPCMMGMNDFGSYGWPSHDLVELKARSSATLGVPNLSSDQGYATFDQFIQKPSEGSFIDSTLQMMDTSFSSTTDWSQNLVTRSGSSETNYQSPMVQENMSSSRTNFRQESEILNSTNNQIQKEWSLENISLEVEKDSTTSDLKRTSNSQGFPLDSSLPMSSSSYGYPSALIEKLFGDDPLPLENQPMNFPSTANYQKKQQETSPFHLNDNSSFWNDALTAAPSNIFPSTQPPMIEKPNLQNLKAKSNNGAVQNLKKSNTEPASKRPRIETPSSLPTFKVRKEKLGDHITALQQLVSPFGKTDTASVLQEAIEYIRFLHDQVNVLSTPCMKNGAPSQQQQNRGNVTDHEEPKKDLRSRGLCLVPISSTFPIANETTADFWTPTFGGVQDREHNQTSLNNAIFCPYLG